MSKEGPRIITLTGRGGVGKTAIAERLLSYKDLFYPIRGVTTRPARPSDKEWENDRITEEVFDKLQEQEQLIMRAVLLNYKYAVRKDSVEKALSSKKIGVRILSLDTVAMFHEYVCDHVGPGAVRSFYVEVSDPAILPIWMAGRGDSTSIVIARVRLEDDMDMDYAAFRIAEEYKRQHGYPLFHRTIYNDDGKLETAVASVLQEVWK